MTDYLICFDFPEVNEPLFAGRLADGSLGFVADIRNAARFERESDASGNLKYLYSFETREYGAVVEAA